MHRIRHSILSALALGLLLPGCSDRPSLLIDLEPALSVLSGAVQATQNSGLVAQTHPLRRHKDSVLPHFFNLIPQAWAATPTCPAVNDTDPTLSYCDGDTLVLFYDNCRNTNFEKSGLWRLYVRMQFPAGGDCTAVQASGFTNPVLAGLVGKTVTRTFGLTANGDQNNVRFAPDTNEAVYMYSDFPTGWKDDRMGGVRITFDSTTERTIVIDGVQVRSAFHAASPVADLNDFNLLSIAIPGSDTSPRFVWDHTLNSIQAGDPLFEIGPQITGTPSTSVGFNEDMDSGTTAPFNGDIVVQGNRVKKGAAIRAQHNIAAGIGVMLVTEDLVWGDPNCCWPTSGTVRGEHDRNFPSGSLTETLEFTNEGCGKVRYSTITGDSVLNQLYHCF
jgi:hypothetical protein